MALFGRRKETEKICGCVESADIVKPAQLSQNEEAVVKILGSGCKKCNELETNTIAALAELGMDTTVAHVTDFAAIAAYGVMSTPALVLGKKVVSAGKVITKDDVIALINKFGTQSA